MKFIIYHSKKEVSMRDEALPINPRLGGAKKVNMIAVP